MNTIKKDVRNETDEDELSVAAIDRLKKTKAELAKMTPPFGVQRWLRKNPVHRDRFDRINAIWDSFDSVKDDPLVTETLIQDSATDSRIENRGALFRHGFRMPAVRYATAVAACLLIAVTMWLIRSDTFFNSTFQTANGEQTSIKLSDGSTVYLDAETAIAVFYEKNLRRIELQEGQAMFSVAHDKKRPFVVTADDVTIRALGTIFNVNKEKRGKVSVAVTQGRVQVDMVIPPVPSDRTGGAGMAETTSLPEPEPIAESMIAKPRLSSKVLAPGQKIAVEHKKAEIKVQKVEIDQVSAWREGKLIFKDKPLVDVINELNRHIGNKIIINDHSLEETTISMNFQIKHYEGFLTTLERTIPVISIPTPEGKYILVKKAG